ncbi:MAG: YezD family protein [Chloroflexi bacterium]|nr:YezD family protein [Chloroflexota bacterium]
MEPWEFSPTKEEAAVLGEILKALRQITHGHIQVVIQDARVVQIDKTEKVRFRKPPSSA